MTIGLDIEWAEPYFDYDLITLQMFQWDSNAKNYNKIITKENTYIEKILSSKMSTYTKIAKNNNNMEPKT